MKKILSLLSVSLLTTFGFAQVPSGFNTNLDWSDIHEIDGEQTIAGVDSQYIYAFAVNNGEGWDRRKWFFTKYDVETFEQVWHIETRPLEWGDAELGFEEVRIINGEFFVFYNAFDKYKDRMSLLGQHITADGDMGRLSQLEYYTTDDATEGKFQIEWNEDGDEFVVVAIPQFIRDEQAKFRIVSYDLAFQKKWDNQITVRTHHENFQVIDYALHKDGNLYVLAYDLPDLDRGEEDVEGKSNQHYAIYKINENTTNELEGLDLELDDYFVSSPWIHLDDHNMHVGGVASMEYFDEADLTFFMTIDYEGFAVESASFDEIPEQIKDRMTTRYDIFDRYGRPFKVIHFRRIDDGGAILVQQCRYEEVDYVVTGTVMGVPVSYRKVITNHYEDYLIERIDSNGQLVWMTHLPLNQVFVESDLFMGDLLVVNNDKFHLIFNDDKDNIEEWGEEDPSIDTYQDWSIRRGNVVMVTMDTNGNVWYEALTKTKDEEDDTYFLPSAGFSKHHGEAIIFSADDEDVKVGRLTISE